MEDPSERFLSEPDGPSVTPHEFFPPEFMREHTQFETFRGFAEGSQWEIDSWDDFDDVPADAMDEYVSETTKFDSWRSMRNRAAQREVVDRLTWDLPGGE